MKKYILSVVSCLLFFSLSKNTSAQIYFDLQTVDVSMSPIVHLNTTDTLRFSVGNFNAIDTFYNPLPGGRLRYFLHFDTAVAHPTVFSYSLSYTIIDSVSFPYLLPGMLIAGQVPIPITTANLLLHGNNEVVIWPELVPGESNPNNNYARAFFYVEDASASHDLDIVRGDFNIYPNPAAESVYLKLGNHFNNSSYFDIVINDLIGNKVLSGRLETPQEGLVKVNLSELDVTPGMYYITLTSEHYIATQKVIKK